MCTVPPQWGHCGELPHPNTFQLLEEPKRGVRADADTQSQIITLIKILRIKQSLIKDPVKLWGCQFSGLALPLCRWWVAKQNQRSLNYKDESQSQKGMREAVLCDGDGPAPISSKLSSPLHGKSHNASKLNILSTFLTIPRTKLIAMPIYLSHWLKLNLHDLVIYVNF